MSHHPHHAAHPQQAIERQMSLPAGAAGLTGQQQQHLDDAQVPPPAGLPLFNDILGDTLGAIHATKEDNGEIGGTLQHGDVASKVTTSAGGGDLN